MTDEKKDAIVSHQMAIVQKEDGTYELQPVTKEQARVEQERVGPKPWKIGVSDSGEDVYAPVAGPHAVNALPLKSDIAVCKVCRCTVHKRNAVVDPWLNVYCKPHWPYGAYSDPRFPQSLPEHVDLGKAPKAAKLPPKKVKDDNVE